MGGHFAETSASERPSVLVVEDDERMLATIERTIGQSFDVTAALDGVEALNLVNRFDFPVVLTDHYMPRMSGAELVTRLSATAPDVVCVVLTGSGRDPDVLEAARLPNVLEVLTKPVDTEDVIASLFRAHDAHAKCLAGVE